MSLNDNIHKTKAVFPGSWYMNKYGKVLGIHYTLHTNCRVFIVSYAYRIYTWSIADIHVIQHTHTKAL